MTGRAQRVELRDGVRLHALRWDGDPDAIPFLLVHGLASNAELWRGVGDLLAAAGHPVVAVDQRAHGRSDPSDALDLVTLTDDLVEVTSACALRRPVMVGQSWGGNVVVELAARRPGVVHSVVGVDGGHLELAARFDTADDAWAALAPPDWDVARVSWADIVRRVTDATPGWSEAARRAQLGNLLLRGDGTTAAILTRSRHRTILDGMYAQRPSRRLADVPVPVLLLPVDAPDTRRQVDALVDAHRRVTARWFHDRHHDVHAQAPHEVAAALLDHVHDREDPR